MSAHPALTAVAAHLRCPHCGAPLQHVDQTLRCDAGHSFDCARQGHVTLPPPRGAGGPRGDSAQMVAARETFLGAGHYAPIAEAVTVAARDAANDGGEEPVVVDLGAGTGYYLAALLDGLPGAWSGIALDSSAPALRSATRQHPRIAAVVCDIWRALPLQDAVADLIVNVFAPRNGPEIARVLAAHGALVVVTPTDRHLRELVPALGMLDVGVDKQARLRGALAPDLEPVGAREVDIELTLGHADVRALVAMGPSAHHISADDLDQRIAQLSDRVAVTASVSVETFRRAP